MVTIIPIGTVTAATDAQVAEAIENGAQTAGVIETITGAAVDAQDIPGQVDDAVGTAFDTQPPSLPIREYVVSTAVTNGSLAALAQESGYIWTVQGTDGKVALGITPSGSVVGKIVPANGTISAAQLAASLLNVIPVAAAPESGYVWSVQDGAGHVALGISADGTVTGKIVVGDGQVTPAKMSAALAALLPAQAPPESGYVWSVQDAAGHVAIGLAADGTFQIAKPGIASYSLRDALNSAFRVYPYRDAAGRYQLRVTRRSDGAIVWDTAGNAFNTVEPVLDEANNVLYRADKSGAMVALYRPASGGQEWPVMPSTDIDAWGDSLTQGAGQSNGLAGAYTGILSALLGVTVRNNGYGGQTSTQIAARENGAPSLAAAFTIPADTSAVSVTMSINLIAIAGSAGTLTGTFAGIPGTLSKSTTEAYTFARATAGAAVAVPANTPFLTDAGTASQTTTVILWPGRNDGLGNQASRDLAAANTAAMVAYLKTHQKRFLVMSVLNGANEGSGTTAYAGITAYNSYLAATYGGNYLDIRRYIIDHGLTDLGITPTAQDLADVAADTVPASLRADAIHLNNYTVVAAQVANQLKSRKWYA